ncbi:MFS family permease [Nocardioides daedukensis]|uniref:MFS family permease n=1 Tax=Nocardioides daedukensis TaxID=634462 RepID=A0A7Y9UR98_9ACTN|nr:MFS transporter [Nocardioides daedukensis]NYG60057.1 MFS family permease [Nocardioides daedukensis]
MSQPPTDPHGQPRSFGEESAGGEGEPTSYDASPGHTPGENAVRFAKAGATGVKAVARGTARASKATVRAARRASHADGAGDSGLSRLIELHAFNAAADAAVAISLAGTLFFQVPTGEARGQVALFLAMTMLPFAIVAPLIGPFLDRFSHGRRWAIGSTMAIRAFLCWVLAGAVVTNSTWLFPAALGVLVSSKAYGITKAAAAPRLVPEGVTLVKANARLGLAGVVGAAVSAPIAGLAATFGPEWSLRYAFLVFIAATILAILLPRKVDSAAGEVHLELMPGPSARTNPKKQSLRVPSAVAFALRANCGPRFLSGFLTMFMAFLLRENPIPGWEDKPELLLGVVIGAAGLGNTLGIALASVLRRLNPAITVVLVLVADAAMCLVAALFYGLIPLAALGLTAGLCQSLGKLSLDSTIQTHVHERVQTSAFARSDTMIQLAWVVGGFVGIVMPLNPRLGLGIGFACLAAWTLFVLITRPGRRDSRPTPEAPPVVPGEAY